MQFNRHATRPDGTRRDRLEAFAERFAAAGVAALVFDHRGFGDSTGEPDHLDPVIRMAHGGDDLVDLVLDARAAARSRPGCATSRGKGGGTQTGDAFDDIPGGALPAGTGRRMEFTGMTVLKVKDGLITEEIGLDDGVTALKQLGLIPRRLTRWLSTSRPRRR